MIVIIVIILVDLAMSALQSLGSIWQSAKLQVSYRAVEQKPYIANASALQCNTIVMCVHNCVRNFCRLLLLQDHYKGYKHQRLVARHKAALHSQGYHHPHAFDSSPHRMPFTPSHHPPGPHPSDAAFLSPVRSPYSHPADRWSRGYAALLHPCLFASLHVCTRSTMNNNNSNIIIIVIVYENTFAFQLMMG